MEQGDGLGPRNHGRKAGSVQRFCDGCRRQIVALRSKISAPNHIQSLGAICTQPVELGPVLSVGDDAAMLGLHPGGQNRSIYFSCGYVSRMIAAEECSLRGKLVKSRRVLRCNEIGAHPIPDHHHMLSFTGGNSTGEAPHKNSNANQQAAFHLAVFSTLDNARMLHSCSFSK